MKNHLLLFLLAAAASSLAADTAPRPNIVLVMADDQGWGDTGYNGHPTQPMIQKPALLLGALFAFSGMHASAAQPPPRPNFRFIAVDDLRDWMNYLGQAQVRTPNFDRLARMGVSFTR